MKLNSFSKAGSPEIIGTGKKKYYGRKNNNEQQRETECS